ncbi:neurofilament heavy polypeptide-like [Penaeus japonicus]|uniref:neurofilament heavy polypeptide-like n=1 Tax=Penaeus japonicus TaxID=27405 RepID=UPI001C7102BB|nr:neurofilament heavy polypeptide-like [Penaeus japonicus]
MPAVEKMGGGKKKAKSMKRKNSIAEPAIDVVSPKKKAKSDKETPAKNKKSITKKIPGNTAPKEALPEKPKKTNQKVVKESKTSPKKAKFKKDNQITAVSKEVPTKEENQPVKEKGQRRKIKSAERKKPRVKESPQDNSTEVASQIR